MLIPEQFAEAPVYDLLRAAAEGRAGMDHRWLRAILDRGEAAVPDINRFAAEPLEEFPISVDVEILMILRHLKSPAAAPFFVEYLRKFGADAPDEFITAILPIRQAALEPLIELYHELEEDESVEVAFCLAAFRIRDDRVLKILMERLEYDLTEGAMVLGLYGDPAARPALEKMLAETADDEHLRQQIAQALEDLGREQEVPEDSFNIWDEFPERAQPETEVLEESDLLEMLASSDPEYRTAAADGFVGRDLSDGAREKLFRAAQTDEAEEVRARCWEALGGAVTDHEPVFKALLNRLKDESTPQSERVGVLIGLGPRADDAAVRPLVEKYYHDPGTRAAALNAMWQSLDRTYAGFFPDHIDDPDPAIQRHAMSGVGYLGIHDSAERLRKYFDNENLRPNALFSYALAARAEVSPARIRNLFRRIEELAGGFSEEEAELVEVALDERLMLHGHKPVFHPPEDEEVEQAPATATQKAGRNDPCPCGSGKKYKKCCGA